MPQIKLGPKNEVYRGKTVEDPKKTTGAYSGNGLTCPPKTLTANHPRA